MFLEELKVLQDTQRREEEEAERQRKIQEEKERKEREVSVNVCGTRLSCFWVFGLCVCNTLLHIPIIVIIISL